LRVEKTCASRPPSALRDSRRDKNVTLLAKLVTHSAFRRAPAESKPLKSLELDSASRKRDTLLVTVRISDQASSGVKRR
jgi:hypothetical protein